MVEQATYKELVQRIETLERENLKLKQTEEALRESEERFKTLIAQTTDAVFCYDYEPPIPTNISLKEQVRKLYEGILMECNVTCAQSYGFNHPEDVIGKKLIELVGTTSNSLDELFTVMIQSNYQIIDGEAAEIFEGGSKRFFLNNGNGVIKDGKLVRWWGTYRDITDRMITEKELSKSETKMRSIFRAAPIGIGLVSDRVLLEANEQLGEITGYSPNELIGRHERILYPTDEDYDYVGREKYRQIEKQGTGIVETRFRRKDGEIINVLLSSTPLDPNDLPAGVTFTALDITDRKLAEEALIEAGSRLQMALKASNIGLWDWNLITDDIYFSPEWKRQIGYEDHELQDGYEEWETRLHPDDRHQTLEILNEYLRDQRSIYKVEFRLRHKDGSYRWIYTEGEKIEEQEGKITRMVGCHIDLTEKKQAEALLIESEEKYKALVENLPDIIARFDKKYRHMYISSNVTQVLDIKPDYILGKTHRELGFPEEQCRLWEHSINHVFSTGEIFETEVDYEGEKGRYIFNWRLIPEIDSKAKVLSVITLVRDITQHRKTEQAYKTLFEKMMDGFALHEIICDSNEKPVDYRFLSVNPAFETMTGLKAADVIGKTVLEVVPDIDPFWIDTYGRVALTGEPVFFENAHTLDRYFEVTAYRPVERQFACIFQNITEKKKGELLRKKLEVQLQQAQKMEAIGTLAGGIAHDFNNILSPIMLHTEMVMEDLPPDSPLQQNMKEIYRASGRARDLVRQILTFSRQQEKERVAINSSRIVKEAIKLLRSTLPSTIDIKFDIQTQQDRILADPSQVHQIIMNLCTNAAHAMEEKGGVLEVVLSDQELDSESVKIFPDLEPGRYLRLSVEDTGHGIEKPYLDKIFEPYFTTKEKGKGTGMGLALVHGIVKSYEGTVTVYSEIGQGTTFHVYIPLVEGDTGPPEQTKYMAELPKGSEHILLVDDEKVAVDTMQSMLERLGYKVTSRTSSIEALELFRNKPDAFDLVITDQTMPNMTGKDLAKEMIAILSDIPIIICTGFSEQIDERKAKEMGIRAFVMKPIVMSEIARIIRMTIGD